MRPTPCDAPTTSPRAAPRILVVDDDPIVLHATVGALIKRGHVAVGALGGAEALAIAPDSTELVLTDISMPGIDGPALAATLSARRPKLKFIFMSGGPESQLHGRVAVDEIHFLAKPFSLDALHGIVDGVLGKPAQ